MLKTLNLSENLPAAVKLAGDNERMGGTGDVESNLAKSKRLKKHSNLSKFKKAIFAKSNMGANKATRYLTSEARIAFSQLKKAFTKATILQHFDSKYYIRIETDASSYTIGGVLNQPSLKKLS